MNTKTCIGCRKDKPLTEYYFRRGRENAGARCKECVKKKALESQRGVAAKDPGRKWRLLSPEKKAASIAKVNAWAASNPERVAAAHEAAWLRRAYGITLGDYRALLSAQSGVCAICKGPPVADKKSPKGKYHVDHDHKTGAIRGLLCSLCNNGMGRLRDDPVLCRAAADYLERHQRIEPMLSQSDELFGVAPYQFETNAALH